jgi:hypothetical protein
MNQNSLIGKNVQMVIYLTPTKYAAADNFLIIMICI